MKCWGSHPPVFFFIWSKTNSTWHYCAQLKQHKNVRKKQTSNTPPGPAPLLSASQQRIKKLRIQQFSNFKKKKTKKERKTPPSDNYNTPRKTQNKIPPSSNVYSFENHKNKKSPQVHAKHPRAPKVQNKKWNTFTHSYPRLFSTPSRLCRHCKASRAPPSTSKQKTDHMMVHVSVNNIGRLLGSAYFPPLPYILPSPPA